MTCTIENVIFTATSLEQAESRRFEPIKPIYTQSIPYSMSRARQLILVRPRYLYAPAAYLLASVLEKLNAAVPELSRTSRGLVCAILFVRMPARAQSSSGTGHWAITCCWLECVLQWRKSARKQLRASLVVAWTTDEAAGLRTWFPQEFKIFPQKLRKDH